MMKISFIISFVFVFLSGVSRDRAPELRMEFSPFQDTVVAGFDTELTITSDYDLKSLSISGTNCKIMLKDAEKGIYVVTAPVTSAGKKCVITVSVKNKNGNYTELISKEVKLVAMTTSMRKRYVNTITHKK